jgi:hypothetical protein
MCADVRACIRVAAQESELWHFTNWLLGHGGQCQLLDPMGSLCLALGRSIEVDVAAARRTQWNCMVAGR